MKKNDEYNWPDYTKEYEQQLEDVKIKDGNDFFVTKFDADNDGIVFYDNLHPNWMEIYYQAWKLKPKSIFECGVGACYHIKNLHTILPDSEISGIDLLQSQLDLGKKFSDLPDDIFNKLFALDFTSGISIEDQYEFVYTQAVIMHLSTENARRFLKNMDKICSKNILLIEGVNNHENWPELVADTLPNYTIERTNKYINYGLLLTKK